MASAPPLPSESSEAPSTMYSVLLPSTCTVTVQSFVYALYKASPEMKSSPKPPINVSLSSPPLIKSALSPPTTVSFPSTPCRNSPCPTPAIPAAPCAIASSTAIFSPPNSRSLPSRPYRISASAPPSSKSLPPSPRKTSRPAPPLQPVIARAGIHFIIAISAVQDIITPAKCIDVIIADACQNQIIAGAVVQHIRTADFRAAIVDDVAKIVVVVGLIGRVEVDRMQVSGNGGSRLRILKIRHAIVMDGQVHARRGVGCAACTVDKGGCETGSLVAGDRVLAPDGKADFRLPFRQLERNRIGQGDRFRTGNDGQPPCTGRSKLNFVACLGRTVQEHLERLRATLRHLSRGVRCVMVGGIKRIGGAFCLLNFDFFLGV